jgi:hypothetical protein
VEATFAEVGGVRVAGGTTPDHADARAPLATGGELLDLAVVEAGRRDAAVLGEHLGEVAATAQRGLQRALQHRFFDQRRLLRGCLS